MSTNFQISSSSPLQFSSTGNSYREPERVHIFSFIVRKAGMEYRPVPLPSILHLLT